MKQRQISSIYRFSCEKGGAQMTIEILTLIFAIIAMISFGVTASCLVVYLWRTRKSSMNVDEIRSIIEKDAKVVIDNGIKDEIKKMFPTIPPSPINALPLPQDFIDSIKDIATAIQRACDAWSKSPQVQDVEFEAINDEKKTDVGLQNLDSPHRSGCKELSNEEIVSLFFDLLKLYENATCSDDFQAREKMKNKMHRVILKVSGSAPGSDCDNLRSYFTVFDSPKPENENLLLGTVIGCARIGVLLPMFDVINKNSAKGYKENGLETFYTIPEPSSRGLGLRMDTPTLVYLDDTGQLISIKRKGMMKWA
jgi:hypothetical protein